MKSKVSLQEEKKNSANYKRCLAQIVFRQNSDVS